MPADIRKLAQEAVGDGDIPADCPCGVCVERRRCRTIARALSEGAQDRDKILAALPHALGSCGCERVDVPGLHSGAGGPVYEWPEEHEAAIEWLRGRIE